MTTENEGGSTTAHRQFHIGDVITVATGTLVSLRHIEAVYDLCGYMTGNDALFTHQLPRAARECEPALRAQHPALIAETIPPISTMEEASEFLAALCPKYGEYVTVAPLPPGEHELIDPIVEMLDALG